MGEEIRSENSVAVVERTIKRGDYEEDEQDEEIVSVHKFVTAPAEVEYSTQLTMNLGNYESAKFSVTLRLPCYKEEIDSAFKFAQQWVEKRLKQERDLIRRKLRGDENPL